MSFAEEGDVVNVDLVNGGRISGVVKTDMDQGLVINVGFGIVAVAREDIKRITVLEDAKKEKALEVCDRHVAKLRTNRMKTEKYTREWRQRIEKNAKIKEEELEKARKAKGDRIKSVVDTHLIVEANINNKAIVRLMVDTGAAFVTISPAMGRRIGYENVSNLKTVELTLADGSCIQGHLVVLKTIKVGNFEARNVKAVIADRGDMDHGLLGMSFLSNFDISINTDKNELVLNKK
ncbi:MAG: retroviral-like aspartic protease family protein [Candidatus Omnitrophica bacterium]|nr:retroviral-like aspartic protease family protein [Candidatus Omnitrophota bacterium]